MADVLLYIDNTIQYGEDLDVKVPKVSHELYIMTLHEHASTLATIKQYSFTTHVTAIYCTLFHVACKARVPHMYI